MTLQTRYMGQQMGVYDLFVGVQGVYDLSKGVWGVYDLAAGVYDTSERHMGQ